MRIESTDAAFSKTQPTEDTRQKKEDVKNLQPKEEYTIGGKNLSQLNAKDIQELPVPEKVVISAIEKANKALSISNRKFEYSIHEKTKAIMIKVIDSDTNEVIREIPPEKILDMVAKMWEMAGIMVDERR